MNRLYKIVAIFIELVLIYLIFYKNIIISCAFKKIFKISCPACGLTRAFKSLLKLDILKSINYNLLSPVIFIFLIILNLFLIYDIINNKKKTNELLTKLGNYYILIMIILIVNTVINNIRGIC